MTQQRMLFASNTARSGSQLISMMLSAHPEVMIAFEAYLELYRSLRHAVVRRDASAALLQHFDPSAPLQDYYFRDAQIELMDLVQHADLDMAFEAADWQPLTQRLLPRMSLECPDLAPFVESLRGATYRDVFAGALRIVADARAAHDRTWLGMKDAWTIEFFTPLARTFPEARFMTILRDPRAVVNSMLGVVRIDPAQVAHVLSYLRHWRKLVAFHHQFERDPLLANRLHLVRYEDVVTQPERSCRALCAFLEIAFDARMLDAQQYMDYATGNVWQGNSSFEKSMHGIGAHRAERWREMLAPEIVALTEFTCGPEMEACGYELVEPTFGVNGPNTWPGPEILAHLLATEHDYANWRTDLGDMQQDFGFELFRRSLLTLPTRMGVPRALLRRSFLFEASYDRLQEAKQPLRVARGKTGVGGVAKHVVKQAELRARL